MPDGQRPLGLRVAIFHDGEDTLSLLKGWLASHGYSPIAVRLQDMRGVETAAGEFVRSSRADVVIFDIGFPYICNWDFCLALQMLPGAEGVPFVFTTANKIALERVVGPTDAYELTRTPENLSGLLARLDASCSTH